MRAYFVAVLALAVAAFANPLSHLSQEEREQNTWVVLAAGSDGYYNYRHQADVCHAYQVVHKMGVPDEHIIVMMKDDIAGNSQNPKPGQIINEPGGPDVYAGVPKDYTGSAVSSDNFVKILTGQDMTGIGSGKTLKSGPKDNVFVFFDDHGSEGALCFPQGCSMTAEKMQSTLNTMASNGLFKKLVFYVEACFAGSVFYKLNIPDNVYITTASPIGASSFAYNWDDTIGAYVADIYSFLWVHDTEVNAKPGYTFQNQFDYIQANIEGYSQTCQYGDKSMASLDITDYYKGISTNKDAPIKITDAVSVFEVPLQTAKRVFMKEPTDAHLKELNKQIAIKKAVDDMSVAIVTAAKSDAPHLASPPCTTCDTSCNCYKYCKYEHGDTYCQFECCNEDACTKEPPNSGFNEARDECTHELAQKFLKECGNDHPYLRKAELLFRRVCKQSDVNVVAALKEIENQCAAFNQMEF